MKARILTVSGLTVAVALVLGLLGLNAPAQNTPAATDAQMAAGDSGDSTNMDDPLASANGTVISTPGESATNLNTNPRLGELVKLVQAGVGDSVVLAYVNNSSTGFGLSSDDIIYLNDLGASDAVVSAMLAQDQKYHTAVGSAAPMAPASTAMENATPPSAPAPDMNASAYAPADPNAMAQTPPLTPSADVEAEVQQAPNTSYGYFYDSLSPYGSWVNIDGYGPCWQPTVVVANPGWQPYSDRGRWAYTDSGWCWVSDYSWGWAPFHYGRWFRNSRFGWCWAPDTVWGPAWVSWRYSDAYCGWAPLPPSAYFRPGIGFSYYGRSVGFNFGFGIGVNNFTFVSINHFNDRYPGHYRVDHREVTKIYNTTIVHNQIIEGNNNRIINRGIPVERVSAATHTDIHPIRIQANAGSPRSGQLARDGKSLAIYRPELPTPKPGQNARFVGEGVKPAPNFDLHSRIDRTQPTRSNPVMGTPSIGRPANGNQNGNRIPDNGGGNNRLTPNTRNPQPNADAPNGATPPTRGMDNRRTVTPPFAPAQPGGSRQTAPQNSPAITRPEVTQPRVGQPRQDIPIRSFDAPDLKTPSGNSPTITPPVRVAPPARSESFGTPRMQESRPAPEMRSAPQQFAPAVRDERPDSGGGPQRGNGGGNGNNGNGFGNGNGRGGRGP